MSKHSCCVNPVLFLLRRMTVMCNAAPYLTHYEAAVRVTASFPAVSRDALEVLKTWRLQAPEIIELEKAAKELVVQ